jgi:hypothetical protein
MQHAWDVETCYLNYCGKKEVLGANGFIMLKEVGTVWTGFFWLRRVFHGGQLQQGSERAFIFRKARVSSVIAEKVRY